MKISKEIAEELEKELTKLMNKKRRLKIIDKIAFKYLEKKWNYAKEYGLRIDLERSAYFIQRALERMGIYISRKRIKEELQRRVYRKFKRHYGISS